MSLPKLPAVVVGIDSPIGLTIIRDLGRSGVPVYGIAYSAKALGMSSRFLHSGLIRREGPEGIIDQLVELGAELGEACLFAVSENDISLLNQHRARLDAYNILFPDEERMSRVLNKDRTYAAAAHVGIRTPRTEQIDRLAQAQALCETLRFPVVLKWANPHQAGPVLSKHAMSLDKTHYCHSAQELLGYLQPFAQAGIFPLIQEYCPGYGLGQFILMKDGRAHCTFQHKRVHEWPPEGGFSSLCESIPLEMHVDLMTKSIALLRQLEWEGIAMVEYRHDPDTGESALMEINGRFWGSLPLAYHAGARFPSLCYALFGMHAPVAAAPYRSGVRCRYMVPETKRLVRILFASQKIADKNLAFNRVFELLGYLADFVRPGSKYYVFEVSDPAPFFSDIKHMLRQGVRMLFRDPVRQIHRRLLPRRQ